MKSSSINRQKYLKCFVHPKCKTFIFLDLNGFHILTDILKSPHLNQVTNLFADNTKIQYFLVSSVQT